MNDIESLSTQALADITAASTPDALESLRVALLGKSGSITAQLKALGALPGDQRKAAGEAINRARDAIGEALSARKIALDDAALDARLAGETIDVTLPGRSASRGGVHPVSRTLERITDIFGRLGYELSDGPEIEDDWHNFTALNLPEYHPARDMQDTFFIQTNPDVLLRTHTSSVQVRYMENNRPPIRTISPGRVFRNEAVSSRSHCIFHQVEGLYIDKEVSFADLKQTLLYFTKEMFGKSKIRMRPSYFPFTEPSAEVDIYWGLKTETDYRITKGTGWLEIMGCGMVDPNVLKNCGINPDEYNGFAFGMGIERIAMLLYQISDIRMFYENDIRFLEQFKASI